MGTPLILRDSDTRAAALASGGDVRIAAERHGLRPEHVRSDLPGFLAGASPAPAGDRPVFYRSVGVGIEDASVALAVPPTEQVSR